MEHQPARLLKLLMLLSICVVSVITEQCDLGMYYNELAKGCAECGIYPDGCTSLDNRTLNNCLTHCKKKQEGSFTSNGTGVITEQCDWGTYYDELVQGCVDCGIYPDGCTSLNNVTLNNCLTHCKKKQEGRFPSNGTEKPSVVPPTNVVTRGSNKSSKGKDLTIGDKPSVVPPANIKQVGRNKSSKGRDLTIGGILGITIGSIVVVILVSVLVVLVYKRHRSRGEIVGCNVNNVNNHDTNNVPIARLNASRGIPAEHDQLQVEEQTF